MKIFISFFLVILVTTALAQGVIVGPTNVNVGQITQYSFQEVTPAEDQRWTLTGGGLITNEWWSGGIWYVTINWTQSGNFRLNFEAANAYDEHEITVLAPCGNPPSSPQVTGNFRIGLGSVTMTASGAPVGWSYKWTRNGQVVSTSASYTTESLWTTIPNYVTVSSVHGGCEGQPNNVSVTIYPAPTITSTGSHFSMQNLKLSTTSTYDTYQWKKQVGGQVLSTNPEFVPTEPGSYLVIVTKNGLTATSNAFLVQDQFAGLNKNYIIENSANMPGITQETEFGNLSIQAVNQTIKYFDGLGRVEQTIVTQGSTSQRDVISVSEYDNVGRLGRSFLPYSHSQSNGRYRENPVWIFESYEGNILRYYEGSEHQLFFQNTLDKVSDDPAPFATKVYDRSPLGRTIKAGAVGSTWQPYGSNSYNSNDRTIKYAYEYNELNEVILWSYIRPTPGFPLGLIQNTGYYSKAQLFKRKTKDEDQIETVEFSDKMGRTVMKMSPMGPGQYAQTYYIYDDFGALVVVLQPEGVKRLTSENYDLSSDAAKDSFLSRWAFRYRYDNRRRLVLKQVPGADSVRMVYDNRDRLILTQDGNQRTTNRWSFTKYDELNRPILTGIKDTTVNLTQALMQGAVNAHFAKASARWGESYIGNTAGNVHGYTNRAYPVRTGSTTTEIDPNKYLTATYYDNYTFRSTWVGSYGYVNEGLSEPGQGITYTQPTTENTRVIGQVTGSKVKVLDGGPTGGFTWLKSITYYDDKYRVIQTIADNYKGGTDRVTNVVDFVGKILESRSTHTEADVRWRDVVSVRQEGNKLISIPGPPQWGFGCASVQQLAAGQDGWFEFTVTETTTNKMIGFNDSNSGGTSNADINYAFQLYYSTLYIQENASVRATVTGIMPGDLLRMERVGSTVSFKKNGINITTSALAPSTSALFIDNSFHVGGNTLAGVRASFATTTRTTTRRFEYDHAGRLLRTWHQLDAQPEILLALNEYNELGQLVDKKLHSTVANGSNAKQSVDYRYNIRGWLTSMNNARLANEAATNDDANDLFGLELGYENTLSGLGNTGLFNGNISGMKYSSYGNGPIKEKGYIYTYDALNRLKTSQYRQRTASVPSVWETATNQWAETGFNYDLNGNIINLKRNETATNTWMDDLTYTYTGNQLLRVTDAGDDFAGFLDGQPGTGNDYTYDPNGNMTRDLNKGIGTSLTDATNLITYNFLNLPETVTKGTNSVRYIYDATGRKLTQVTTFGSQQKQTDYAGEFIYESDALQFINHEEGRIAVAATKMVYTHDGVNTTGITAATSTLAAVTLNAQTYIRATAVGTTARQGMFPIGGTITVAPGEQYRIRAKGYRTGANTVHVYARLNSSTDLNWPGSQLANGAVAEAWSEQIITIPGTTTATLHVGVVWNTVTAGEQFFLNDFEITKLETTTPEYQYHLKDHLGNVRLSFTSKDETVSETATYETANQNTEQSQFVRYQTAKRINSSLFDRTNGAAPGFAQRLNGSTNERYGIAKSISVMPGDVINAEVYVKYVDPVSSNWNSALTTLMGQIAASTAGVVVDGSSYTTSTSSFPYAGLLTTTTTGAPRAYLNWLVFDRNFGFITGGFRQMGSGAKETGTDVAHELLTLPAAITITQPGYVYIYLSNESPTLVDVFFDDFKVTHTKSPVIQAEEYYPFGLTFHSYSRENSVPNKFKFQGQEHIDDLNLGWVSFKWRNHQPDIGRFFNVDPLSEKFYYNSPYAFSENKVTHHIELEGLEAMEIGLLLKVAEFKARTAGSVSNIQSAGGRLVSGNSGNVPSEVPMSDGDRQMVKLVSQISDAKMVTDGVKDITKTGVRMGAEEAQNMGDAIETAGVVTAQPEIAALGKGISMAGKGVEMAMDASEGNLTTGDVAYEVGKEVVFSGMSNAAEKGVKAGNLDKKAGDIFQVFVKGWEMLTDWGKSVFDDSNKKK